MDKNNAKKHPLQCRKCTGTVLPDRAICLPNGVWVLRYVCISCDCRWHAIKTARQWVLVEASTPVLTTMPAQTVIATDNDDSAGPAIAV